MESVDAATQSLAGLNLLVVDDDYFVANDCATILRRRGARVTGPVQDMARARASLFGEVTDCVLLDINLKGEMAFSLAEELDAKGIPLVFTTGYDPSILPASLRKHRCLLKPLDTRELVSAIRQETERRMAASSRT